MNTIQRIIDEEKLEQEILALGNEIFDEVRQSSLSLFDPKNMSGKLLGWAMSDADFKVSLFRLVDVIPSLSNSSSVVRHVQEYFFHLENRLPTAMKWGLKLPPNSILGKILALVVKRQLRGVAGNFMVGATPKDALKTLHYIRKQKRAFTVDLLGEATLSEAEAEVYLTRYLELLETLGREVPAWPEATPIVSGHRGESTPINISVKLSALYSQAKPVSTELSVKILSDRLAEITAKAKEKNAFVYVDMEDTSLTSITLKTFQRVFESSEFKTYDKGGIVLQAYLRRTENDLEALLAWAKHRSSPIAVRLVKGAYWDTETIAARQQGWPVPVWHQKSETDANFEKLALRLLENSQVMMPAFGSHNIRSLCFSIKAAELMGIAPTEFELQALYGMAEPVKASFVRRGYLLRDYAPIGELIPGMAYFVRRLLENTSNEGFLRQSFHEHEHAAQLLQKPKALLTNTYPEISNISSRQHFTNFPLTDFTCEQVRNEFHGVLQETSSLLRRTPALVKPIMNGVSFETENLLDSISPEDSRFVVANVRLGDVALAEDAIQSLLKFFPVWRETPIFERAEILFKTAELLSKRRHELSAITILEAGKQWREADADVTEAIDFLNYYAHQALQLFSPQKLGEIPGEDNTYFYEPRGISLVISPWNFPSAIPCGMFCAALVTGNCTILKPAEQTSLTASYLFKTFLEAGLPKEAATFLPALGETVGAQLVKHPKISTIAFTGSKEVGLQIIQQAGFTHQGAAHVKRVIVEMGGKNAIIVDDDADMDEAIKGVISSAFSYQGQKCSACSRVIIVGDGYHVFLNRLTEAVKSLVIGPPSNPESFLGPVIDEVSFRRMCNFVEKTKQECKVVVEGVIPPDLIGRGFYVAPVVFTDVPADHALLKQEIFGPVLAVVPASDFTTALEMALDSEYALTGAVYSRSPKNIELAFREFRVGNLYINRGTTGAVVLRQPFGGAKMSGIGSKAGGPDYLLQFVIPRVVSENTIRRGFAPMSS